MVPRHMHFLDLVMDVRVTIRAIYKGLIAGIFTFLSLGLIFYWSALLKPRSKSVFISIFESITVLILFAITSYLIIRSRRHGSSVFEEFIVYIITSGTLGFLVLYIFSYVLFKIIHSETLITVLISLLILPIAYYASYIIMAKIARWHDIDLAAQLPIIILIRFLKLLQLIGWKKWFGVFMVFIFPVLPTLLIYFLGNNFLNTNMLIGSFLTIISISLLLFINYLIFESVREYKHKVALENPKYSSIFRLSSPLQIITFFTAAILIMDLGGCCTQLFQASYLVFDILNYSFTLFLLTIIIGALAVLAERLRVAGLDSLIATYLLVPLGGYRSRIRRVGGLVVYTVLLVSALLVLTRLAFLLKDINAINAAETCCMRYVPLLEAVLMFAKLEEFKITPYGYTSIYLALIPLAILITNRHMKIMSGFGAEFESMLREEIRQVVFSEPNHIIVIGLGASGRASILTVLQRFLHPENKLDNLVDELISMPTCTVRDTIQPALLGCSVGFTLLPKGIIFIERNRRKVELSWRSEDKTEIGLYVADYAKALPLTPRSELTLHSVFYYYNTDRGFIVQRSPLARESRISFVGHVMEADDEALEHLVNPAALILNTVFNVRALRRVLKAAARQKPFYPLDFPSELAIGRTERLTFHNIIVQRNIEPIMVDVFAMDYFILLPFIPLML